LTWICATTGLLQTYRLVGVAIDRLRSKKVDFSLKMISDITVELQVPLSTIFSSVIWHDYVELLANVAGHLNCYLNFSAQSWLLKC